MFLCDNCAKEKNFYSSITRSYGKCEICDKISLCGTFNAKKVNVDKDNTFYFIGNFDNMDKKIIGYKCPCDLFKDCVKKGDIFVTLESDNDTWYVPEKTMEEKLSVPKELVETWEPIYENNLSQLEDKLNLNENDFIYDFGALMNVLKNDEIFFCKLSNLKSLTEMRKELFETVLRMGITVLGNDKVIELEKNYKISE